MKICWIISKSKQACIGTDSKPEPLVFFEYGANREGSDYLIPSVRSYGSHRISSFLGGLDSLVSIVQMPKGVPVATVGMGSSYNAAILAGQILSLKYPFLRDRIKVHKKELEISVETEDNSIRGQTFHT